MPKGQPNKRYTPEFKIKVVETMQNEKLSYREAARQFDINDHHRVADWERIYLEEGKEGFYIEREDASQQVVLQRLRKKLKKTLSQRYSVFVRRMHT